MSPLPPTHRVAVLQSSYMPWKGYFDIIHAVDEFVFYDDLQFTKSDWRNRNKIKTAQGPIWLSIPVGTDRNRLICEVEIQDPGWQLKHWRSLQQNYGSCPFFARYAPYLEHVYLGTRWQNLSALNHAMIRHIAQEFLGLRTRFSDSRSFELQGRKLDRLLDLVRQTGATEYLSGPAARDYIEPEQFAAAGIGLAWQDYQGYPEYAQRHPPFSHQVSVLDLLFCTGPDAPWYIWGWREGASLGGSVGGASANR